MSLPENKIFLATVFLITLIFPVNTIYAESPEHTNNSLSFYVDINHGKDSNPGTIDLPFKTIQKARDTLHKRKINVESEPIIYLSMYTSERESIP